MFPCWRRGGCGRALVLGKVQCRSIVLYNVDDSRPTVLVVGIGCFDIFSPV